jgi:formate C-acetyltransferase
MNENRKRELIGIAEACSRVPFEPARSFYEALQSVWFIHLILQIESNGHSVSLGRFDQYLYPYFQRDVEMGLLTEEQALVLIEHFWVKLNSINKIRPWCDTQFITGYPMFQNLTIGGQKREGGDAANTLSYLCLNATADVRLTQPSLSARIHVECDDEYLRGCCETIRLGLGMPAMFNDEVIIPALLNRHVKKQDAYDYAMVGCVEVAVPGKWGYRCNGMSYFNMLKVLELTLNDGIDPKTGKQLCRGNGNLETFASYDEIITGWREQLRFYTKLLITHDAIADAYMEKYLPNPFCSMLVSDCIGRAKTLKEGGAVYDVVSAQSIGLANIANSLAAVRKLVYEENRIDAKELKDALSGDFNTAGGREIQQILLNEAPKYGNDDDYVDLIGASILMDNIETMESYKNSRYGRGPVGGGWQVSTSTVSSNIPFGWFVGATPDGRRNGEPLADGISPAQGTDRQGPTSV